MYIVPQLYHEKDGGKTTLTVMLSIVSGFTNTLFGGTCLKYFLHESLTKVLRSREHGLIPIFSNVLYLF